MIWFDEVKKSEVTAENIDSVAKWLRAKTGVLDYEGKKNQPVIVLKTARGYLLIQIGDEILIDSRYVVKIIRQTKEIDFANTTMPTPKSFVNRDKTIDQQPDFE